MDHRILTVAAFTIAAGLLALLRSLSAQETRLEQQAAECAVYAAVLQEVFGIESRTGLGVSDQTIGRLDWTRGDFVVDAAQTIRVDSVMWANYRLINAESTILNTACFSAIDAAKVGHRDDLGDGHYVSFSKVGFTPDMKYALVHTLYYCGPRCGNGQLLLLASERTTWVVRHKVPTVIF